MNIVALILLAAGLSGCVGAGHQYDYQSSAPTLASAATPVAVAVHDRRSYVLNGSKSEDFLGLQRNGLGMPFDVRTQSGRPLAADMAQAIAAGMGGNATAIPLNPGQSHEAAIQALQSFGKPRALLLTVREWKMDTLVNSRLSYDMTLEALAANGRVLAAQTVQGSDDLGGDTWGLIGTHAKEVAPEALRRKIEELYNGQVAQALREKP